MPPKSQISKPKKVKKVKTVKKKGVDQKGGIHSQDDPDTSSSDEYFSENSDEDIVRGKETESEIINDNQYEELDEDDKLGNEEKVDDEMEEDDDEDEEEDDEDYNDDINVGVTDANVDDDCMYDFGKNKKKVEGDDDVSGEDDYFEDDYVDENTKDEYVLPEERQTKPILFIYERVSLASTRARQLSLGAKPMVSNVGHLNVKQIVKLELDNKTIPLFIVRQLPNGKKEKWYINEFTTIL